MKEYVTVKEFSEMSGIPKNTIYRLIRANAITHYKIGKSIRLKPLDFKKGGNYAEVEFLD